MGTVLPTLTPSQTQALDTHFQTFQTLQLPGGFITPATQRAISAGTMALANELTLRLQTGQISQADYDYAINALTPAIPVPPPPAPIKGAIPVIPLDIS